MTTTLNVTNVTSPITVKAYERSAKVTSRTSPFTNATTVDLGGYPGLFVYDSETDPNHRYENSYECLFYDCQNLTSATNFNSNTTSMSRCFYNCSNLTTISAIPNSVVNMYSTFYNCQNLTTAPTIPNSVSDLSYAFSSCNGLTTAPIIPDSVTNMGYTFASCNNLNIATIHLPSNPNLVVSNILGASIKGATLLSTIDFSNAKSLGGVYSNCVISNNIDQNFWNNTGITPTNILGLPQTFKDAYYMPEDDDEVNIVSLPNNVINLSYTFSNCNFVASNLAHLVIPNSVKDMSYTFNNTLLAVAPNFPNGVINISGVFSACPLVNCPAIPNSVINMSNAFCNCGALNIETVHIPASVKDLSYAFNYCQRLTDLSSFSLGSVVNLQGTFYSCANITHLPTLPSSVNDLGYTFYGCWNIVNLANYTIPDSITDLDNTFRMCKNLTHAPVIPNSVTSMNYTFQGCESLLEAPVIPSHVTDLNMCFHNCTRLTSITNIPNGITTLPYTFQNCTSITNANITIPNSVTNMHCTFFGCINLTQAPIIPNSVEILYGTFQNCISLVAAPNIPVTTKALMMYQTFRNCTNLTGNIYIHSPYISSAAACFGDTTLTKNIYIPFTYGNGINTQTYNSFINAGYDTVGTNCGVYLKDLNNLTPIPTDISKRSKLLLENGNNIEEFSPEDSAEIIQYICDNMEVSRPDLDVVDWVSDLNEIFGTEEWKLCITEIEIDDFTSSANTEGYLDNTELKLAYVTDIYDSYTHIIPISIYSTSENTYVEEYSENTYVTDAYRYLFDSSSGDLDNETIAWIFMDPDTNFTYNNLEDLTDTYINNFDPTTGAFTVDEFMNYSLTTLYFNDGVNVLPVTEMTFAADCFIGLSL